MLILKMLILLKATCFKTDFNINFQMQEIGNSYFTFKQFKNISNVCRLSMYIQLIFRKPIIKSQIWWACQEVKLGEKQLHCKAVRHILLWIKSYLKVNSKRNKLQCTLGKGSTATICFFLQGDFGDNVCTVTISILKSVIKHF